MEMQLTKGLQPSGGPSASGSDQKRSFSEGDGSSQQPTPKKPKWGQRPSLSSKSKSSRPSSSAPRSSTATLAYRPIPRQGMICFKCGGGHRTAECSWTGECRQCGQLGHIERVCRQNPSSIIKWEQVPTSSTIASLRGSVQMLAAAPTPQPPFSGHHPPGIIGTLHRLLQFNTLHYLHFRCHLSRVSGLSSPWRHTLPAAESAGRPDVVTGTLLVDSCDALVLFDSGLSMQRISQSVIVNSPGGIIASSTVCPGCVVSLNGEDFVANLMVI